MAVCEIIASPNLIISTTEQKYLLSISTFDKQGNHYSLQGKFSIGLLNINKLCIFSDFQYLVVSLPFGCHVYKGIIVIFSLRIIYMLL